MKSPLGQAGTAKLVGGRGHSESSGQWLFTNPYRNISTFQSQYGLPCMSTEHPPLFGKRGNGIVVILCGNDRVDCVMKVVRSIKAVQLLELRIVWVLWSSFISQIDNDQNFISFHNPAVPEPSTKCQKIVKSIKNVFCSCPRLNKMSTYIS